MKRYSKPLGELLDFKKEFFLFNDSKLEEFKRIASVYQSQPQRLECKNCSYPIEFLPSKCFTNLGIEYSFCPRCGHCNGKYEDTAEFCQRMYVEDGGRDYSKGYSESDIQDYKNRVANIYRPKAEFLKDALIEIGKFPAKLVDFGAGAGYFVSAVKECGFNHVIGYEPSETLMTMGNSFIENDVLIKIDLNEITHLVETTDASVASFIGVIEHLQKPREILKAFMQNDSMHYLFFSVPLFSPTVIFESVFTEIMPRHLVGGHTHLYTEQSIQYFCDEFGLERLSEWWFGLDMIDLFRSVVVSLQKINTQNRLLESYMRENFMPLIDKLQGVMDEAKICSEVHMLLGKEKSV